MKCVVTWWFGFLVIRFASANYTFTYEMASRCKEHISKHGYKYEKYYSADPIIRNVKIKEDISFELHIAILASSNGHILLSSVPKPDTNDPVYEIVIGGGGNTFTELRRNLKRNSKSTAKTIGILSPIEYRAFYIKIDDGGLVEFGREGDKIPILSYYDTDPVSVRFFSFTSWNGVEAKFLYDCPVANENGTLSIPTNSKVVEKPLTYAEALKQQLLKGHYTNIAPKPNLNVYIGLNIKSLSYDAFNTKLHTTFAIVVSWTDDSMAWNPQKFNGTTSLKFRQSEIWTPLLLVANSVDTSLLDSRDADDVSMVWSGEATLRFRGKMTTWCMDETKMLTNWPRDEYTCYIELRPWNTHDHIQLKHRKVNINDTKMFTDIDHWNFNEWDFTGNSAGSDIFAVSLTLKRRGTSYNIVFYTPLLVLLTFLLMSFWTEPLKLSRVWFYEGTAIVMCMGLSFIDTIIPCHSLPSIMVFYVSVLVGILIALIVQILQIYSYVDAFYKSDFVNLLLKSGILRSTLCLPPLKSCNTYESLNEGFAQEDDDPGVNIALRNSNVEEMQVDREPAGEKEEVAEVIDKIMFLVYFLTFTVMLAYHF